MGFTNRIQHIFAQRRQGSAVGYPSLYTASMTVFEAALQYAKDTESIVPAQARSNQNHQFDG